MVTDFELYRDKLDRLVLVAEMDYASFGGQRRGSFYIVHGSSYDLVWRSRDFWRRHEKDDKIDFDGTVGYSTVLEQYIGTFGWFSTSHEVIEHLEEYFMKEND